MKKILILGHKGMLGNALCKYLGEKKDKYTILTVDSRWGDSAFENDVRSKDADFIINCIGAIPQKKPTEADYHFINVQLPVFLEGLGAKVILPSTDCEFSGTIPANEKYTKTHKRDAEDIYGKSKRDISQMVEDSFKNTKIIRTSIIGHETNSAVALLDWFLSQEGKTNGYVNHYWNGLTTLQWAKVSEKIIDAWEKYPTLNQFGTEKNLSKYEVLLLAKHVYNKSIEVIPFTANTYVNRCALSDEPMPPLEQQLEELKKFYKK
jgi:dTDP-4-dehydrorhamnose reductase